MSPCQVSSYKLATLCQVTSSARVATITRAMLTIMENEILNFLKRRSGGSKNKVRPVNPKTNGRFCWAKCFLEDEVLVCNIQTDQMDMSSRISKLFIELPNYLWNEVLWHWPLCFLAKKCPFPLLRKKSTQLQFSAFQVSNADLPRTPSASIRYAHLVATQILPPCRSLSRILPCSRRFSHPQRR